MTLGKRLRERRERFGLTQLDAARELGISNVQLSRYESDDRKPEPEMLSRFAEFYRTTTDYLLGRTEDSTLAKSDSSLYAEFERFVNNPEHGVFFKEYLDAPAERKEEMLRFWEFIREKERNRKPGDRQGE
ncbi:helix-turn-helix domain-containing protein [Cohnella thailandensis]|uniref:Helix-turn-helix transcriptional regulator n=1 Tax=Cohnella thailandensis TaxID=557557 RepID=A0A841T3E1_9BACL|nr:helix-turn-helix domain-containing protein [Cohnella thailandensis]MBB6637376.1 helix-turn-helix transcriptional regulator [Cohnella thailandensis]MBP1976705.1 transcriptional regulator with XRE-family HTH domain [Cohnella thailandensis]